MRNVNTSNIEELIINGENDEVELKRSLTPSLEKDVVAFANTKGGVVIIGYDELQHIVVGVNTQTAAKARNMLKAYSDLCEIYCIEYGQRQILIIEVSKADKALSLNGRIYYREHNSVKFIDLNDAEKLSDTIMNSIKGLTLSELSYQTELGKEYIKKTLDSPVMNMQIASRVIGNEKYYEPSEDKLPLRNNINNFKNVTEIDDLIPYLENRFKRIDGKTMLHQYTNIHAALNIIQSHEFYIGSPSNMNDLLEYQHFDARKWEDIFFTCFMEYKTESVAMWSQYAQPWDSGIRLSLPAIKIKEWLNNVKIVDSADPSTKKKDGLFKLEANKFIKSIHMVAYTNEDDIDKSNEKEIVTVGKAENNMLENLYNKEKLCGYVKNAAWDYEKEIRFRIQIDNADDDSSNMKIKAIRISIPDDVIKSIEIMKGPRVPEDSAEWKELVDLLRKEGLNNPSNSIFEGKLINMACDRCIPNQEYKRSHHPALN